MGQTVDEVIRIQLEIMAGFKWGDPRSKVTNNEDNRAAWDTISADLAAMKTKGITSDLPFEADF